MPTEIINRQKKRELRAKPFYKLTMPEKYSLYDIKKIGYFDIETTNLHGDFGFVLSWAMEKRDTQTDKVRMFSDCITKRELSKAVNNRSLDFDRRILENWLECIKDVDLLIGHYATGWRGHDFPFVRARCAELNIKGYPTYREKRYMDTWKMSHLLYRVSRYSLDSIGRLFGVKTEKTPVAGPEWQLAHFGDEKSLRYVVDHNKKDVIILREIHKEMEPFLQVTGAYV